MNWKIPYFALDLGDEEKRAVLATLESNWLTSGPRINEFEEKFATCFEDPSVHAVTVSNCTVGLHLALKAMGIQPGDEVICPSLTFVATSNAVLYCGAKPVFADIASTTDWTISTADIERKITAKTKAIAPVHYGGYACDMTTIMAIAKKYGLLVLEDVSHAPLVKSGNGYLGAIGDCGCFSFFSNKNMTTGEGGMIVTKNPEYLKRIKILRSHGMTTSSYERFRGHAFGYDVTEIGFNYRMDEMRAALGLVQLSKLADFQLKRKRIVTQYKFLMNSLLPHINFPFQNYNGNSGYHIFPILLPPDASREHVMEAMAAKGIQTSIHYRPVHTFSAYQSLQGNLPILEEIMGRILSLPLYPTLTDDQVGYVVESLKASL